MDDLGKRTYLCIVALATVWLGMAALHGIADVWLWGHNGFNGAAFWNAARNSLRFGTVGQALYHFDTHPPSAVALYTHHPLLLHFHLIAMQRFFGPAEWAGRAVPAFYSVVDLLLLAWVTRKHWDRRVSAIATVVYALTPLNLIFANMIDHEQGSIAFLLVGVDGVVTYLDMRTTRPITQACVGFAVAAQWDWPAYPIAFLLFCIVAWHARAELRGHLRFLVPFAATMLASFAAFFGWIWLARGSLADMRASFAQRTGAVEGYAARLFDRSLDLYGPLLLVSLVAALVLLARRRRAPRDLFVAAFLLGQLFHTLVFRQAGYIHAYWTWHANPCIAIAVAELVDWALRTPRRHLAYGAAGVLLVWQAVFAVRQAQWGYATGAASYAYAASDTNQRTENLWAREVARTYPRETTRYWVSSSIQRRRVEFDFHLDAPAVAAELPLRLTPRRAHEVALLDLHHLAPGASVRQSVIAAIHDHAAVVWDDRFLAVDVAADPAPMRHYYRRDSDVSWWRRWTQWGDDDAFAWFEEINDSQPLRGDTEAGPYFGGKGGAAFDLTCSTNDDLQAIEVALDGDRVAGLRPWCDDHRAAWYGAHVVERPVNVLARLFGRSRVELPTHLLHCASGALTALTAQADRTVRKLAADCAAPERETVGISGHYGDLIDGVALQYAP